MIVVMLPCRAAACSINLGSAPVDLGLAAVVLVGYALLPVVALVVGARGKRARPAFHATPGARRSCAVAGGIGVWPHREPQSGSDQRGRCQPDGELREPVSGELVA